MKKLLFFIGFVSLSINAQVQNEYQESTFQGQEEVSQHNPNVDLINSSSVGQTIKIGDLEIMKKDLGFFTWDDTNAAISALGNGWRLPTKKELYILHTNRKIIGGFDSREFYCSSTYYLNDPDGDEIECLGFTDNKYPLSMSSSKTNEHKVRAVRTVSPVSQSKVAKKINSVKK
jgi:hypothetical protein